MSDYLELYEDYITIRNRTISDEGFVAVNCPLHNDRHASAGISITTGVFNCYKCGAFSAAQFISKVANIPIEDARDIVDEFRVTHDLIEKIDTFTVRAPRKSPKFEQLYKHSQKNMNPELSIVSEYMEARQLSYETLVQQGVGYLPAAETHWNRDSLVFPYLLEGKVVGIRYRDILGNKGGELNCHFTLWHIDELEGPHDVVLVAEGETDALKLKEAVGDRYVVVSTATAQFRKEWVREFEAVRQVILIPQADEASTKMITQAQQALGSRLTVVELPWRKREWGKDICDWVKKRSYEDLVNLIDGHVTPVFQRIMSGRELKALKADEQWLIRGLLGRRQACIIAGPQKSMKTWLALNMVRCLLSPGEFFCGIPDLQSEEGIQNVCFVEEEGNTHDLKSRAETVLEGTDWEDRTWWMHHMGVRLDSPEWVNQLEKHVRELNIDLLFMDPLQRLHVEDENDSSSMGRVWSAISRLLTIFPKLSIILLHHFTKVGEISDLWAAMRGSSRLGGEADLGIFVEKRSKSEPLGIKVKFDGRSIVPITTADDKDVFKLAFQNGIFSLDSGQMLLSKHEALIAELENRGSWGIKDAAQHYGVSVDTIRAWAKKVPQIEITPPAPGRPASMTLKTEE